MPRIAHIIAPHTPHHVTQRAIAGWKPFSVTRSTELTSHLYPI